jgi:hypothetical protein
MIQLHDKETGKPLGTITEAQLQYLQDHLEVESAADQDYYINEDTIDTFENEGADSALVALLRAGMGGRKEMEITWSR